MKRKGSKITDVLAMLVFAVFALGTLLVLLISARVYRDLTDAGEAQFDRRTAVRYITTRVHQAQAVTVETFGGSPALVIREETDTETCLLRIYFYEGTIRELYCEASAQLLPEDGEVILQTESLHFALDGHLLTVELGTDRLFLHIPEGTEVRS